MISSKKEFKEFLERDYIANWRFAKNKKIFGDENWKFIKELRRQEYFFALTKKQKMFLIVPYIISKYKYHLYSIKCGYTIPINVCQKGLALPHRGTIVINTTAKIGENCRIHEGVTIGSTSGSKKAATIGNNVFIGTGAKIIGDIYIADDVCIGANSVVVKSIFEKGVTYAGNPAKKISNKNSHDNLSPLLFKK